MDRGTWWSTVNGVTKDLDTTDQLNNKIKYSTNKTIITC